MRNDLLFATAVLWAISLLSALIERVGRVARVALVLGCCTAIASCILTLLRAPGTVRLGFNLADTPVQFRMTTGAGWLLLFGLLPALFSCLFSVPALPPRTRRYWMAGLAATLLGAIGVFGLQDGVSFLIAWEVMSVGGAAMILGESPNDTSGRSVLFMLGLLEVGAVALLLAILLLGNHSGSYAFASFRASRLTAGPLAASIGWLLLIGFGAKLGVLPFYEWFPAAYGSGSGATGIVFSGVVLNAAFFALARGLLEWLPLTGAWIMALGITTAIAGVLSAILAILIAFQEEDWRRMLSLSSAENAGVAVGVLGASLIFAVNGLTAPAAMAWIVCVVHLAGHSLAKGTLFLTADGVYSAKGNYFIRQTALLRSSAPLFGIGALFASMSLAALPPQSGFVTEWYVFQTLFQGMQVNAITARLTITILAAGLALVAAVALATFAKLFGIGLLGDGHSPTACGLSRGRCIAVFLLGSCVLALAVGLPWWVRALSTPSLSLFGVDAASRLKAGWLLVPLSGKFAFISPTKLVIAGPLLAFIPLSLWLLSQARFRVRRVPLWSGGRREDTRRIATTSLAFSNALRTFYGFIYGPTHNLEREYVRGPYFVKRLVFNQEVAPIFGPYLFAPVTRVVRRLAEWVSSLQSGYLNFYNALIGGLLFLILGLSLFYR